MRNLNIGLLVSITLAFMFAGCAVTPSPTHPWVDKIVRVADQVEMSESDMHNLMTSADVVYLGEIHDNPWHHELQLEILQRLVAADIHPAIGFEFFNSGQTGDLMSFSTSVTHGSNSDKLSAKAERQLRNRLGWGKQRDDEWQFYFPIIDYAKQNSLAVFGTDLPAGIRRRITRKGISELSPVEQRLIVDTGFHNDAYRTLMQEGFVESHCGWNDPVLLDNLYETWLARNDSMATAITDMLASTSDRPIVMIVGAGHTKYNMGIYDRVAALMPSARQVNIAFKSVQDVLKPMADYFQTETVQDVVFANAHEYFWFTPALEREDPCVKFKHQLKKPPPVQGE
ncbi:MAG: ChaN family lipoprotein [Gammaproteobacteria bacterium]|nr:ChaN family lipoprotein [Gammaproteobacteria bacterium]